MIDIDQILQFEEKLLINEIRKDIQSLSSLIADDFFEFGSSGKIWTKQDVLDQLPKENLQNNLKIIDFTIIYQSQDFICVSYKLLKNDKLNSLRSSSWQKFVGKWMMVFHQGTVVF